MDAYNYVWTIGKSISSSGELGSNISTGVTDKKLIDNTYVLTNISNVLGMNNNETILYVHEYSGETWKKRTLVNSGSSHIFDATTDGYRLVFGYAGATHNEETQNDINANFSVRISGELAKKTDVEAVLEYVSKAVTTDYSNASSIPQNMDYNTLLTVGNYYCSSNANAQTMTNCPVTVSHRLIVITKTDQSRLIQIILANTSEADIYYRSITSGTVYNWKHIVAEDDTITKYRNLLTNNNKTFTDVNDAPPKVITMTSSIDLNNMPKGHSNVIGAGDSYGVPQGSLLTFDGATYNDATSKVQMFFGQSSGNFTQPVMNFRTKYYSNEEWRWTPWAQFAGLFGVLRATNTFINESRIQAGTADFDDMDNAPNNTIYQIDLNAVSMAHNPISGRSCVLVTISPSFVSQHGSLQLCAGLELDDAYTPQLYFRYGYQQSSTEFRWTKWLKIATVSTD